MLVSLIAAVILAADGDPDGVIATAPETPVLLDVGPGPEAPSLAGVVQEAAPHGLTTDQQIERWLESRDPEAVPYADRGPMGDDREVHGHFNVGVGTAGYRDYGAAVSLPLGDTGRLDLSYRQVENGRYGYGDGYGYGYDRSDRWVDHGGQVFPARRGVGGFEPRGAWPADATR